MLGRISEVRRLAVLHGYEVLDTPNEPQFDAIVRTAAAFLRTPIALISLLDEDRQWFKARFGIAAAETPRSISFCTHAIRGSGVFQVPDARADARFADNPSVIGEPFVRFYAGAPLEGEHGARIGTLCVADVVPRPPLQGSQLRLLRMLATRTMTAFTLRRDQRRQHRRGA